MAQCSGTVVRKATADTVGPRFSLVIGSFLNESILQIRKIKIAIMCKNIWIIFIFIAIIGPGFEATLLVEHHSTTT